VGALYAAGLSNHWVPKRDSALYLSLGRSLAEGRGMEFNGQQTWGIPPLVPLVIAGGRLLVGNEPWLPNLAMTLFAFGAVALTYLVLRELAADLAGESRDLLVFGALLVTGTSARLFIDSRCILTDVPFLFWVMLGLYAFLRARRGHWGWCLIGSVAFVAATCTRILGPVFFAVVVVVMLLDFRRAGNAKRAAATLAGSALVGAGFWFWMAVMRRWSDPEAFDYIRPVSNSGIRFLAARTQWAEFTQSVASIPNAIANALADQKMPWISLLPAALVVIGMAAALGRRQHLVVWLVVVYVAFLVGVGGVDGRYLLAVMPILVYFLLLGVLVTMDFLTGRLRRSSAAGGQGADPPTGQPVRLALLVTVAILAAISLPKVAREIYWLHHPQFTEVYAHGAWRDIMEVGDYLREHGRPGTDLVASPEQRLVHFVSRLHTDPLAPGKERQDYLTVTPADVVDKVVRGSYRFVVVPTDVGQWSSDVLSRLDASGVFLAPPHGIGVLAVYERRPEPSAPTAGSRRVRRPAAPIPKLKSL